MPRQYSFYFQTAPASILRSQVHPDKQPRAYRFFERPTYENAISILGVLEKRFDENTAGSYAFSSAWPPPPPPPFPPNREDSPTPASFVYDNGTGRLDPGLVRDQGLPPHVKTTEQFATFIKSRNSRGDRSPVSSSHYSMDSPVSAIPPYRSIHRPNIVQSGSFEFSRPSRHNARTEQNSTMFGARRKYDARPVFCILPGTTRKHKYEGFWLGRATMRKIPTEAVKDRKRWVGKQREGGNNENKDVVETSGWYDD
ncbi:uncharacterized protein Z518_10053 [Rhinocladiella mackenziei CBS 650.93]|uniref:Rhinocladiella mackenziei CBS 650.93 unplaced genomic scaffold supercont1.8, whole genome shotgun sequence n=1 Tax=Rhinocladiella mackenziei CBS 650.93 TaxID=1442369 RepID=A0A0D2FG80_9EURO|nr:uncharacterized protein Z518_10053 [Rhinocladiella mackenziei CBS 650.93]KIX00987.1 hypothetical protein Z518_10053 [Rhinocladiella mackenziei CBS 650.93]